MNIPDVLQRWLESKYKAVRMEYGVVTSFMVVNKDENRLYSYIDVDVSKKLDDATVVVYAETRYGSGKKIFQGTIQFGDPKLLTKLQEIIECPLR